MVKRKIVFFALMLTFVLLTGSCFIVNDLFIYDSDTDERRERMYDYKYLEEIHSVEPLNIGTGDYSFIVLTDIHIRGSTERLENGLLNLIAENPDVKFIAILGDLTNGGEGDNYNLFIETAKKIAEAGVPLYPVAGNHDFVGNGWNNWKNKIGSTNYKLEDGNTTIIVLDSGNIYFGKKQLDWLENQLKTAKRDVFIFSHTPIFSTGFLVQIDINERARIIHMLQNKGKAFFGGHTHNRHTQRAGNVDYINLDSYRDDKTYLSVSVEDGAVSYKWGKFR